ncbi:UNVERIFIED_CONTAM: hypothetical protein PYX00_000291 [Menopon gallinae]|uniref:Uncharacterized protein n=1 Tax=Menopon gallinae TaxID=328185 RepID=A0AAW2I967_9NEOP
MDSCVECRCRDVPVGPRHLQLTLLVFLLVLLAPCANAGESPSNYRRPSAKELTGSHGLRVFPQRCIIIGII